MNFLQRTHATQKSVEDLTDMIDLAVSSSVDRQKWWRSPLCGNDIKKTC